MGRGGARRGQAHQPADPALGRLCRLPLVPCHGARELRIAGGRGGDERAVRQHQGRSRGAPRRRRHLHAGAAYPGRAGRLAAHHVLHARRRAVLGRHLLPLSGALRPAELHRRAARRGPGLPRQAAGRRDQSRRPPEGAASEDRQQGDRDHGRGSADPAEAARSDRRAARRGMRSGVGRFRPGAEISLALPVRDHLAGVAARAHQCAAVRGRHRHARPPVPGRHLRSPGRRLRALRHRRRVADPAFREDALRQCAAHRSADAGLAGDQEPALRRAHRRDLRLGAARNGSRRRRFRGDLRCRQRGRRGQVLCLGRSRDRFDPGRRCGLLQAGL